MAELLSLQELPNAVLVRGKVSEEHIDSTVQKLVESFNILPVDLLKIPTLTVDSAQAVRDFSEFEPVGGLKLIAVCMEKATARAQNSLLALLESPPPRIRFVLFGAPGVLSTIESRCVIFNTPSDIQVSKQSKVTVLAVLKAASELNDILLEDLFKNWDDEASSLLLEWAVESFLKKPGKFTLDELSFSFPPGFQHSLIVALSTSWSARGRFSAKSTMLSFVGRIKGVR